MVPQDEPTALLVLRHPGGGTVNVIVSFDPGLRGAIAWVAQDMSLLSVTAQFYWRVSIALEVSRRLFTPPPKVDSQILILNHRASPLFGDIEAQTFFMLVKTGFAQPVPRHREIHEFLAANILKKLKV